MFLEIADLLKKYDPVLKNHLENGPRNAMYTSNRIQNVLILSIHNVLFSTLCSSLKNSYISIIADETSDCGHQEQMSVVIRYFDKKLNTPVESFIGLQRLLKVDAQSIFDSLNDMLVNKLNLDWSAVLAVCFDGASNILGSYNGVQAKFKEKNSKLMYVHCYAHCLNLMLVDSIGPRNKIAFNFFGIIQLIYSFIEGSCIRHAVLEKVSRDTNSKLVTLKSLSTTRWACRSEAIAAIKLNYSILLQAIEEIKNSTRNPEIKAKAKGLIINMKSFKFIFALNMLHPILLSIAKVSSKLQTEKLE